jgi:uncharacterized protein YyaL (SSP411 family)
MTAPGGGFYSTQDADSEGHEGKFFVWSQQEIEALLDPHAAAVFGDYFGVSDARQLRGQEHSQRRAAASRQVAQRFQRRAKRRWRRRWRLPAPRSLRTRETRIKPGRDEKILTEWNGLMIHALAECGVVLDRPDALGRGSRRPPNFILTR